MSRVLTLTKEEKPVEETPVVVEKKRLFRRKPLLVEAQPCGTFWKVQEAGRVVDVPNEEFSLLYEAVDITIEHAVDVGMPDMEPGTVIEKDGRRLMRVSVIAGRGRAAYWHQGKPHGQDCGFQVIADMIDDPAASHYAGLFLEPWEGGATVPLALRRTWVVVPVKK